MYFLRNENNSKCCQRIILYVSKQFCLRRQFNVPATYSLVVSRINCYIANVRQWLINFTPSVSQNNFYFVQCDRWNCVRKFSLTVICMHIITVWVDLNFETTNYGHAMNIAQVQTNYILICFYSLGSLPLFPISRNCFQCSENCQEYGEHIFVLVECNCYVIKICGVGL